MFYLLLKQAHAQLDEVTPVAVGGVGWVGVWVRGDWHFVAATAIKTPKTACQLAADDILWYEICCYYPMDIYLTN